MQRHKQSLLHFQKSRRSREGNRARQYREEGSPTWKELKLLFRWQHVGNAYEQETGILYEVVYVRSSSSTCQARIECDSIRKANLNVRT